MTYFAQARFSNMPIALLLLPEGKRFAFTVLAEFTPFYDTDDCYFHMAGFTIGDKWYAYDTTYACDEHLSVVEWLRKQQVTIDFAGMMVQ